MEIKLNERKTTTGDGGNLWYEETLPPETVFYALLLADKPRRENSEIKDASGVFEFVQKIFEKHLYLQIGGNETVGQGGCQVHWPGGNS